MTKKDYELLATAFGATLRELRDNSPTKKLAGFWLAINICSDVAQKDNPRFVRVRFYNAIIYRSL